MVSISVLLLLGDMVCQLDDAIDELVSWDQGTQHPLLLAVFGSGSADPLPG